MPLVAYEPLKPLISLSNVRIIKSFLGWPDRLDLAVM